MTMAMDYWTNYQILAHQQMAAYPRASTNQSLYTPQEILGEGVEKYWSHDQNAYVYTASNKEKKRRKENLESLISYYYKSR